MKTFRLKLIMKKSSFSKKKQGLNIIKELKLKDYFKLQFHQKFEIMLCALYILVMLS